MGIPSYYSYLIKNYKKLLKNFKEKKNIDNFYLDSNSIIYDCLNDFSSKNDIEEQLITNVCLKIDKYIKEIKPTKLVYISFDGVAPVAKLKQQKERRYKSKLSDLLLKELHLQEETYDETYNKTYNETDDPKKEFDKTCITPGTSFMKNLDDKLHLFFNGREKIYGVKQIIISSSLERGEGEHKIFDLIRQKSLIEKNSKENNKENHIVYGLDADLIILCLNHLSFSKDIYLFRETPEFVKSINTDLNPNELYIMDMNELMDLILVEMTDEPNVKNKELLIKDYVLLMMFMGNDFLPHFPSLNIRTFGIQMILDVYRVTLGNKGMRLIYDNGKICWANVREIIEKLSNMEHDNFKKEYKIRDNMSKRFSSLKYNNDNNGNNGNNGNNDNNGNNGNKMSKEKIEKEISTIPLQNRDDELYINPHESYWEDRYYETLFDSKNTEENMKKICLNYLEGLEWNMRYYVSGCYNWKWKYNYNYPPLFKDLIKYTPIWDVDMIEKNDKNITETQQLGYVLPENSLHLLEKKDEEKIKKYKLNNSSIEIRWSFCKYFWESHILFYEEKLEDICNLID
mgnify:FL=1